MSNPSLAPAELAVMEVLWEGGQLTARAIREQLYPKDSKSQHGTVQNLLQRLEKKGLIERDNRRPTATTVSRTQRILAGPISISPARLRSSS